MNRLSRKVCLSHEKLLKSTKMKKIITLLVIIALCTTGYSQQNCKSIFIRVFDHQGRKFEKGFLAGTSDSTLTLSNGNHTIEIPMGKIDELKLKRSLGHTVLMTSLLVG
jgi:hypothetical protein